MSRFVLCACCALVCAPASAAVVTYDFDTLDALPAGMTVEVGSYNGGRIVNDWSSSGGGQLRLGLDFGRSVELLSASFLAENGTGVFVSGFACDPPPPSSVFAPLNEIGAVDYSCFSDNGIGAIGISGTSWDSFYDEYATAYLVSITLDISDGVRGDTNGDNIVDVTDLNNVRNNFGGEGLGDTNGDSLVGIEDLNAVRNNFGNSLASVPEPSSIVLLSLLMLATGSHIWRTTRPQ